MIPTKTILRMIGPTKIKDGLFMGDEAAAHDYEWITTNQVTHIVNCCGREVEDAFEEQGIHYLTFPWSETETQLLFDPKDVNLNEVMRFIEEAGQEGGSVLVHSKESDSRSCCILSAYLMRRFKWNLFKTLEFLNSRKEDVELEPQFFQQLNSLQSKLSRAGHIKSGTWEAAEVLDAQEEIVRNTYLNSRQLQPEEHQQFNKAPPKQRRPRLIWKDKEEKNGKIAVEFRFHPEEKLNNTSIECKRARIKSILKGSNKVIELKPDSERLNVIDRPPERPAEQGRNRTSKSLLEKANKKPLAVDPVDSKPSTKSLCQDLDSAIGSGKAAANKENIREFYDRNELLKQRQRIGSYERFKKAYLEAEPKKKDSGPKEDHSLTPPAQPPQQIPTSMSNNWMAKADIKGLKVIKAPEEEIGKKESKPIIIVKPNLNMTIIQPADGLPKRATSEKRKEPTRDLSKQQRDRQVKERQSSGNPSYPDVYLRALKERMLIESNNSGIRQSAEVDHPRRQPSTKKERSSSAKPKNQDKARERQLFTINNLLDLQVISKPKWKF